MIDSFVIELPAEMIQGTQRLDTAERRRLKTGQPHERCAQMRTQGVFGVPLIQ